MKKIIFIIMIFLLISSWFFVIASANQKHDDYNTYISSANQYIENKIYIDAIECYKNAIDIYPDILENKIRLALIYKDAKMYGSFEAYCIELSGEYESREEIINMLGDYYVEIGKEEKAITLYKSHLSKYKDSKLTAEKLNELKSAFKLGYNSFTDITDFHNGYAVFKKADKYGIMNNRGKIIIKAVYDNAGVYSKINSLKLAPVLLDGEYYYIDLDGNRRLVSDVKYDYLGSFSKNGLAVFKRDNMCGYVDKQFDEANEKYDAASAFYDGNIAAVKKDDKWFLLDERLKKINSDQYEEIKTDDLGCAMRSNIIFAKQNGKYLMLDNKGNKITEPLFDDADFFSTLNEYAAVKIGNKWGFVNCEGKIIIEPKYESAFSFSCGLAPVLVDGLWGYIDTTENLVIAPQFKMAKSFNSCGVAPVLKSEWHLLSLIFYGEGVN